MGRGGWGRWFGVVWVLGVLTLAAAPARAEFAPPGLAAAAEAYAGALYAAQPSRPDEKTRDAALAAARAAMKAGDATKAVPQYERAVTFGARSHGVWMELGAAWLRAGQPDRDRALQAAWMAYASPRNGPEQTAAALARMADLFETEFAQPATAVLALHAIAQIAGSAGPESAAAQAVERAVPGFAGRYLALRRLVGLTLRNVEVDADASRPVACLIFHDALSDAPDLRYGDFVTVEPAADLAFRVDGRRLCLTGIAHGTVYALTLREGLPGSDGVALKQAEPVTLRVPDRRPSVAFRGSSFILPRTGAQAVPLVAVNVDRVDLKIFRVVDRGVAPLMRAERTADDLGDWEQRDFQKDQGELVWEGKLEVPIQPNRETTAAIPFAEAVPDPKPGLYVVTATPADVPYHELPWRVATQWLLVSDIGLTAMEGADGITVFARSFSGATPIAGAEVALVARNNAELARATTDAKGRAAFPAGLAQGQGGRRPLAVMAYAGADYAVLDLTRPGFDLSDRGVGGRAAPGPMDAFLYTDRGVYRQNERVNLSLLLRDGTTRAVEGFPLTVSVLRPGGTEYRRETVTTGPGGGAVLPIDLSSTAPLGGWSVRVFGDPSADPIATLPFQVEDFVPERLAVEAAPSAPFAAPGEPFALNVAARFLYGPPAAGLTGTVDLAVEADPDPFPAHAGFRFGLVQEEVTRRREEFEIPATDESGASVVPVELPELPDVTKPLRASLNVAMAEPGGRPSRALVTVPVRIHDLAIGLKPLFSGGRVKETDPAAFEVIALDRAGARTARSGLTWELIEEQWTFHWYYEDGRYHHRSSRNDVVRETGTLSVGADAPAVLSIGPKAYGRYRIEVADAGSGVAASLRYVSGWQPSPDPAETPDALEIVADKPAYRDGETARLRLTPPFAGEALLTIATDRVHESRTFSVPAEGMTVEVPVAAAAWGPGAYVTATVYRPPSTEGSRQPVRAVGLAWLAVDPAERTLTVDIAAPEVARPRGPTEIVVKVAADGPMEEAFVTLAAVDEGILRLTGFASPDPAAHFFGKRRLGLDIRDDYGRLIDPFDGALGVLRQGGDGSGEGLPALPFRMVSLFQGPVKVGADGTARVTLDVPDFNGELRLMAVAYSAGRVGSAARPLTVRDPLVAEIATPRFLAPGDDSRLTLNIHNVEAAAGAYAIAVDGSDGVAVEDGRRMLDLPTGERRTLVMPLKGVTAGIGRITVSVAGPDGLSLARGYDITVRPARPVETRLMTQRLEPGTGMTFTAADLAPFLPGTARMAATFTGGAPFDVAGVLGALDRYPYGCVEQTISRALPLLVVDDVERLLGRTPGDGLAVAARVDRAIARVLDMQTYDGSFGVWSGRGEGDAWLTAYAAEFLVRARTRGHTVPKGPLDEALEWLRRHAVDGGTADEDLASRAYALHVMALAGMATPSPARYFHDAFIERLPTPLARAQVAAALARLGDRTRAEGALALALDRLARDEWAPDYGSTVRDAAAIVTLLAESGLATPARLAALVDRLPASAVAADRTSTQEQAWLVLAAETLARGAAPARLTVGSETRTGGRVALAASAADLAGGLTVANAGDAAVWQAVSLSGVPVEPRPAAREGLRIKRQFLSRAGEPVSLDAIRQNDVFVILLEGQAETGVVHQAVVTHPLPAGWEIENLRLGAGEVAGLDWLGELTATEMAEARDDRFVAAVNLTEESPGFRLAYLVRAVTPGTYELPGAAVEDMYKPRFFARQAVGRITVHPAE